MEDKIKANTEELWEYLKDLCESPITYSGAQRIVTCHKAYKILCEMADGHAGHDQAEHGADHHLTEAMAKAFLDDKDAQPHKLARYYEYIVRH